MVLERYLPEGVEDHDYMLSPIFTPNDILKQYPPNHFFIGSLDPIKDDCFKFSSRMIENGVNTTVSEFKEMMH